MTANSQGLGVCEFNFDILLLDSGKFAMKLIAIGKFLDIEFRGKGFQGLSAVTMSTDITATVVLVEIVKKTEQRVEGCRGVGANE